MHGRIPGALDARVALLHRAAGAEGRVVLLPDAFLFPLESADEGFPRTAGLASREETDLTSAPLRFRASGRRLVGVSILVLACSLRKGYLSSGR